MLTRRADDGVASARRRNPRDARKVTSIESYAPAVTDADFNLADYENVELIEGRVEDVLESLDGKFDAARHCD